jgi:hypothetical protein
MGGPVIGAIGVVIFLVLLIGLPVAFMVWSRRAGEGDLDVLYRGLRIYQLPAPDLVEVNFRIVYGLIAPVRIRFVQVFASPQDARVLMQRVQTLNLKRSATHLVFPVLWLDAYLRCQRELRSIDAQARKIRTIQRPSAGPTFPAGGMP